MALKKRNTIKQLMAFTLAELLMTMAILGVVAALTIPSIKKYSQRETVGTELKKAYTTLNGALDYAISDDIYINPLTIGGDTFFTNYLRPKMKTIAKCNSGNMTECWLYGSDTPTNAVITQDGITIGAKGFKYYVDINATKLPNRDGVDVFFYDLKKESTSSTNTSDVSAGWAFVPTGHAEDVMLDGWRVTYW